MAVLLIDENFDSSTLSPELKKLYNAYLQSCEKKTTFEKFQHLKHRSPDEYERRCKELAGSVTYINWDKRRKRFIARPKVTNFFGIKKNVSLGSYENFDDACEALALYLKSKLENK